MVRPTRMPEQDLEDWLDQGTYEDWLLLARMVRNRLAKAIQEADSAGDGPLVNALCAECRKIFKENLIW